MRSYGSAISSQHQSTFWTFTELFLPQITGIVASRIGQPLTESRRSPRSRKLPPDEERDGRRNREDYQEDRDLPDDGVAAPRAADPHVEGGGDEPDWQEYLHR